MNEPALRYCVLLKSPQAWDSAKLAQVYAGHAGIPFQDAAHELRNRWGIVAEDLEEAIAKTLADRIEAAGLGAMVLPANLLEELPEALSTCKAEWDDAALRLLPRSGERAELSWPSVALVAAASYRDPVRKMVKTVEGPTMAQRAASLGLSMATGLPVNIGGKKQEVERLQETSEPIFFLDICARKPLRRYRVDFRDFNFACLGKQMEYSSLVNFRTLVQIVAARTPSALRSRGTQVLLDNKPVASMGYDSLKDLDRECRWLLTLASLKDP